MREVYRQYISRFVFGMMRGVCAGMPVFSVPGACCRRERTRRRTFRTAVGSRSTKPPRLVWCSCCWNVGRPDAVVPEPSCRRDASVPTYLSNAIVITSSRTTDLSQYPKNNRVKQRRRRRWGRRQPPPPPQSPPQRTSNLHPILLLTVATPRHPATRSSESLTIDNTRRWWIVFTKNVLKNARDSIQTPQYSATNSIFLTYLFKTDNLTHLWEWERERRRNNHVIIN